MGHRGFNTLLISSILTSGSRDAILHTVTPSPFQLAGHFSWLHRSSLGLEPSLIWMPDCSIQYNTILTIRFSVASAERRQAGHGHAFNGPLHNISSALVFLPSRHQFSHFLLAYRLRLV